MVLHCGLAVLLDVGPLFFAVGSLSADAEGVHDLGVLLGSCFLVDFSVFSNGVFR